MDIIKRRVKQFEIEETIDRRLTTLHCTDIVNLLLLKLREINRESTKKINDAGWINMFSLVNKDLDLKDSLYYDIIQSLNSTDPCFHLKMLLNKL